jgi:hypothetical protein
MKGYVYVLTNSAHPDLVKIGRTVKEPSERALELSTTGVPTPYVVAYYKLFANCVDVENNCHQHFFNVRVNRNREFFRVSARDVIQYIISLQGASADESIDEEDDKSIHLYLCLLRSGLYRIGRYVGGGSLSAIDLTKAIAPDLHWHYKPHFPTGISPRILHYFAFRGTTITEDWVQGLIRLEIKRRLGSSDFMAVVDGQTIQDRDLSSKPVKWSIQQSFGLRVDIPFAIYENIKDSIEQSTRKTEAVKISTRRNNF